MTRKTLAILLMIASLSAAAMACSISIPGFRVEPDFLPDFETFETGELQVEEIMVEARDEVVDLDIGFGAGELDIRPGGSGLVSGEAIFNVEELEPVLIESENRVSLTTGNLELDSFPTGVEGNFRNEWNLSLGDSPMNLDLDIGASSADLDFGGIPLHSLTMDVGAADLTLDFSSPTTMQMDRFDLEAGASSMRLEHLGNLNTRRMSVNAAAGDFNLDFTGELAAEQDLFVEISMAAGQFTITVPEDSAVSITVEGALVDVDTDGDWTRNGDTYSQDGENGSITMNITAGAGQLDFISK